MNEEELPTEGLSQQAKADARQFFEASRACSECGGMHSRACPRVKRVHVIFNPQGTVIEREVEYWRPGLWETDVVWPEDVYEED